MHHHSRDLVVPNRTRFGTKQCFIVRNVQKDDSRIQNVHKMTFVFGGVFCLRSEVTPPHLRSTIFGLDRVFEGVLGASAAALTGSLPGPH